MRVPPKVAASKRFFDALKKIKRMGSLEWASISLKLLKLKSMISFVEVEIFS